MNNVENENPKDFCPECGCNIAEVRREKIKEKLFEETYGQRLVMIRKRAKTKRAFWGAIVGILVPLYMFGLMYLDVPGPHLILHRPYLSFINFFWLGIIFLFGFFGADLGRSMGKFSKEENELWQSFDPARGQQSGN